MSGSYAVFAIWSFASVGMLAFAAAAAIPIAIHLWNRRQRREADWAAIQFLQAALRKQARHLKLEQWLLLAVRASFLLLLAVAWANPVWEAASAPAAAPDLGPTHTVLVVDTSYSMAARSGQGSCFEKAKEQALQLVDGAAQGDGFTLILLSDPPRQLVREVVFDAADLSDELSNLPLQHAGADLSGTLLLVRQTLERVATRYPRFARQQVCVFSDMQRRTWQAVATPHLRRQLDVIAELATWHLFPTMADAATNVALVDLRGRIPLLTPGTPLEVEAELRNFGSREQQRRLSLLADGQVIEDRSVVVPAGATLVESFRVKFEQTGSRLVEARLDTDLLPVDDHRWLSVPVVESVRVLCVEGKPGAARFVALALDPREEQGGSVQTLVVGEQALLERQLSEFDCIWLCNVGRLGRDERELLRQFVIAGGGLIVTLGDQVQPSGYAAGPDEKGGQLLPARLTGSVSGDPFALDPLDYKHPILKPFRGHERAGLLTVPIWCYVRAEPVVESVETVLRFARGDPLLLAADVGAGKCLLWTTAVSTNSVDPEANPPRPWTAISSWPSFPPLIHEMTGNATRGRSQQYNRQVGETLRGRVPLDGTRMVQVISPTEQRYQVKVDSFGPPPEWSYPETGISGVYRAEALDAPTEVLRFAVNVQTAESELATLEDQAFPEQLLKAEGEEEGTNVAMARPTAPFRLFLGASLVLLMVESGLGWWYGRRLG